MEGLVWIAVIIGLFLKVVSLYFGGIACFTVKKAKRYPEATKKRRFAVLTAARNEEAVIGGFVDSIYQQEYPKELFDVYVIPNNCSDHTEEAARKHGAKIIRCAYPVKCKGDALQQAFQQLMDKGYDGFCVFDSDNRVKKDFLLKINDAFEDGAKIAKGRLVARNAHDSWVAGCYGIYFDLFHIFFNRAREACGLSSKLVGTGFAVHQEVLEALGGWKTTTLAEDAEFAAQCATLGERVRWVPEAITYDEQPISFRESLVQRRRWCSGIMQVAKIGTKPLLGGMNEKNRRLSFDFLMFLAAPFAQALSVLPVLLTFLAAVMTPGDLPEFFIMAGGYVVLYYAALTTVAAGLALWQGKGKIEKGMKKAVFMFPIFMASWIPLQVISLFKETRKWEEIKHRGERKKTVSHTMV